MSEPNPIIEKLKKLIAHEQSARNIGSLAEAEAFAARIQDLLTAHKLSMSEVDFTAREEGEPIDWEHVNGATNLRWRVDIARVIADINSCSVVNQTGSRRKAFFFVGRTSDRQLAKILYEYLTQLGEDLAKKAAKDNRKEQNLRFYDTWKAMLIKRFGPDSVFSPDPKHEQGAFRKWMKDYTESWKTGFGAAVSKRLKDRYEATLREQEQTSAGAIVHIKRDALAVKEFLKGKTRKSSGVIKENDGNQEGFAAGHSTGSAVNLSPNTFAGTTGRTSRLLS